jgi:hypothetical protein
MPGSLDLVNDFAIERPGIYNGIITEEERGANEINEVKYVSIYNIHFLHVWSTIYTQNWRFSRYASDDYQLR